MSSMPEFEVLKVEASVTFPLRREVLGARPNEPNLEDMARPDDDHPDSGHFAVFDEAERVIGTGTVRRREAPWLPDETGYQIRGMAVEAEQRGRGIGAAVLAAIINHVDARGGGLLWCQARTDAQTLYERAGFRTHGDPTMDESSGEQVAMYQQMP
jgi:GNAT superfamily N-acetyltransferase